VVRTPRHYKRTDLFLVRLWPEESEDGSTAGNDSGQVEWHGKVQRVVDGESHPFRSLPGLVDVLLIMLGNNKER
jgi:hypothetical protein